MANQSSINVLEKLIAQSYELFGKYDLDLPVQHGWYPDEYFMHGGQADPAFFKELQKPLKEISERTIINLASEGYFLKGAHDFRHYLPRILELVAFGPYPEEVFRTLKRAGFETWPQREQALVTEFVNTLFEHVLAGGHGLTVLPDFRFHKRGDRAALDYLEAAVAVVPLSNLLTRWHEREDESAVCLLVKSALLEAEHIDSLFNETPLHPDWRNDPVIASAGPEWTELLDQLEDLDSRSSKRLAEVGILEDDDSRRSSLTRQQIQIAEFLLSSLKVHHILQDRQRCKQLKIIDSSVDIKKLRLARAQLKAYLVGKEIADE